MDQETGTLAKDRLVKAGWASIGNATLSMIPLILLYLFGMEGGAVMGKLATEGFTFLSLILTLFLLKTFRKLLNTRFQFHAVDDYVSVLIWGNIVTTALTLLSLELGGIEETTNMVNVFVFIFFGIVSIMFSMRLLRLNDNLFGLLKPFCYTTVAMGVCFAAVILIPLGVFLGAVSDIILGTIFFRASEQPVPPIVS